MTDELPDFLCSACYETSPGTELCALPWWNDGRRAFFMTHRCKGCFAQALTETKAKLADWNPEVAAAFESFLETWSITRHFPQLAGRDTKASSWLVVAAVESSRGKLFVPLVFAGV